MRVLGVRCSNTDFSFVVLEGTQAAPIVVDNVAAAFPKGFSRAQALKWLYQEAEGVLAKHEIDLVVVKRAETMAKPNAFHDDRVANEGIVELAASYRGIDTVRKVKATMAKDLGQKGKARYLASVNTSLIEGYEHYSVKMQEALFAGWSGLI